MGNTIDYANAVETNVNALNIDCIYITGAGYVKKEFKGISRDSAMGWEETVWGGDLTRSTDFVLSNIEDVDFGLVAREEISYKYMNIEQYKALCKISKQRVCYVIYFNREKGQWETGANGYGQEMAFTGNELKKLHTYGSQYLGVLDISIKLVATNRDRINIISASHTISYNANQGSGTIASQTATWGDNKKLADSGFTRSGYTLVGWDTQASGTDVKYFLGQEVTVFDDITLYAVWEAV